MRDQWGETGKYLHQDRCHLPGATAGPSVSCELGDGPTTVNQFSNFILGPYPPRPRPLLLLLNKTTKSRVI